MVQIIWEHFFETSWHNTVTKWSNCGTAVSGHALKPPSQSDLDCFRWWTAPCLWLVSMWRRTSSSSLIWSSTRWPLLCLASPLLSPPMPRYPNEHHYWLISGTGCEIYTELVVFKDVWTPVQFVSHSNDFWKHLQVRNLHIWSIWSYQHANASLCLWDRRSLVRRRLSRDELKVSYGESQIAWTSVKKVKYSVSSSHKHSKTSLTNSSCPLVTAHWNIRNDCSFAQSRCLVVSLAICFDVSALWSLIWTCHMFHQVS